jgi:HK97 family phage major capsid protein
VKRSDEIRTRQAAIKNDLEALEGEVTEKGESEELTLRFEALTSEWDELAEELKPLAEREDKVAAIRSAAVNSANRERTTPDLIVKNTTDPFADMDSVRNGLVRDGEVRGRAKSVIERFSKRHDAYGMDDDAAHNATALIERHEDASIARHVLDTSSPEYLEHFRNYLKNPVGYAQRAAMALSPSTAGGLLVPTPLDPSIILSNAGSANPFRQVANVKQTTASTWNGVTSAGVNAGYLGEGATATDNSPTVGPLTLTPKKLAAWVEGSYEFIGDSDFAQQLPTLLADAKDRIEAQEFAVGAGGSGAIKGVVTAGTVLAPTGSVGRWTIGTLKADDVYTLQGALPPRFRAPGSRPVFIASLPAINQMRNMPAFAGAQVPFVQDGPNGPTILSERLLEASAMDSTFTAGKKVLAYFDGESYVIADRIGMSVLYNPIQTTTAGAPTGQAGWFAFWRTDADAAVATAIRVLSLTA